MELSPRPYVIRSRKLSTETVSGRLITVTREEKDYVLPDWDLGRQGEEPLRHKDGEVLLEFDSRFWRCYHLLHFIACRVLGGPERAEKAVENCWHAASRNPPHFEYAGAFRTWLVRVLIEEALALRESQSADAVGRDDMCESHTKVPTEHAPLSVAQIPIHFPEEVLRQRAAPEANWKDSMRKIERSMVENNRASYQSICSAIRYLDPNDRQNESGSALIVAIIAAALIWVCALFILLNGI